VILRIPVFLPNRRLPKGCSDVNVVKRRNPFFLVVDYEIPDAPLKVDVKDEEKDELGKFQLYLEVLFQIKECDQSTEPQNSY